MVLAPVLGLVYLLGRFVVGELAAHGLQFAGAEIMTYVLVAGGFGLLLVFAFLAGHFSDIERPKFDLLESECRRDREEFGGEEARER